MPPSDSRLGGLISGSYRVARPSVQSRSAHQTEPPELSAGSGTASENPLHRGELALGSALVREIIQRPPRLVFSL